MKLTNLPSEAARMTQMSGNNSIELQEAIRRRAMELFRNSGGIEGHDIENWHRAEAEIVRESETQLRRRAVVINLHGVIYTGEYQSALADGYVPGEWQPGEPVSVRLAGDKLYLRRHNGRELQTTIVKRIG